MPPRRNSTPLIAIGVAVFVIGAGLAFFVLRNGKSSPKAAPISPVTTTTTAPGAVVIPGSASTPSQYSFNIPQGKTAVAVNAAFVPGLAGFVRPNQQVDIYANVTKGKIGNAGPPSTKLIATNVPVLAVVSPPPTLGGTGTVTLLLALDASTAEQVIFFETNEALYFTLVPPGSAPAATPGRDYQNAV